MLISCNIIVSLIFSFHPPNPTPQENAPNSIAQMPVPVPASRTRFRGLSLPAGETNNLLSCIRMQMLCCRSAGVRTRQLTTKPGKRPKHHRRWRRLT